MIKRPATTQNYRTNDKLNTSQPKLPNLSDIMNVRLK